MDSNAFAGMFYEKTENERKVIAKRHAQEINDRYVEVHGGSLFIQVTCCLYRFLLFLPHILLYNKMMIFILFTLDTLLKYSKFILILS